MNRATCFFGGAAIGAAVMYYFDPDRGRGRRSVCEAQWGARGRRAMRELDKAGRDLTNRATGLAHEARHLIRGETPTEDGHRGLSFDIMHDNLAPGTRLFLGSLGSGLLAVGMTQEAPEACVLGTIGAALILPAVVGRGAASGFGLREAHRNPTPRLEKNAPAERAAMSTERRAAVPVM